MKSATVAVQTAIASDEVDSGDEDEDETPGAKPGSAPTATPRPFPTTTLPNLRVERVADGLLFPQSLAFAPDGRLLFTEVKKGLVRVLVGGRLQERPVILMSVPRGAEHGLVGLTLDPAFATNHYLYTYYTQPEPGETADRPRRHRLTRWTERDGVGDSETVVLDNLPTGKCCHTGGKMAFTPDGMLFLALGDQGDADRRAAQRPDRLNGKVLRVDVERAIRERPDPREFIWASGLRNPYGLDIHPFTGDLWVNDNGPDQCDELNLGRPGANYGNPLVECSPHASGFDDPEWDSGVDRLGLTGLRVYDGAMFPDYQGDLLFCSVNTGNLMRARLARTNYRHVEPVEQVVSGQDGQGCRLDLAVAPDGSIVFTSMTAIYRLLRSSGSG